MLITIRSDEPCGLREDRDMIFVLVIVKYYSLKIYTIRVPSIFMTFYTFIYSSLFIYFPLSRLIFTLLPVNVGT